MESSSKKRGVSKAEWLDAGLKTLAGGVVSDVKVDSLARQLGVARSGFYWHFLNRRELLLAMLDHWLHESTEVVVNFLTQEELGGKSRLLAAAHMIHDYRLARFDFGIRQWAREDREAAKVVRKVDRLRLRFVSEAFAELGFEGEDLEARARTFMVYQSWEPFYTADLSAKKRRQLIERHVDLLTRK